MEVLFFLVPIALLLGSAFVLAFFMAVKSGQFEDLDADGLRFLADD